MEVRVSWIVISVIAAVLTGAAVASSAVPRHPADQVTAEANCLDMAGKAVPHVVNGTIVGYAQISGRSMSDDEWLACGGKALIVVDAPATVEGKRGTTVEVPLTFTYRAGTDPYPLVQIVGTGVSGIFIPASASAKTTPGERAQEFAQTGKITGALDLDSTLTLPPVTLTPGETKTATMTINIPSDWPDELVGKPVSYPFKYQKAGLYDEKYFGIDQDAFDLVLTE